MAAGNHSYNWRQDPELDPPVSLTEEERRVYQELLEVDPNGEAWFDDNDNIPEYGSRVERIRLMRERIAEIEYKNKMPYWVKEPTLTEKVQGAYMEAVDDRN